MGYNGTIRYWWHIDSLKNVETEYDNLDEIIKYYDNKILKINPELIKIDYIKELTKSLHNESQYIKDLYESGKKDECIEILKKRMRAEIYCHVGKKYWK